MSLAEVPKEECLVVQSENKFNMQSVGNFAIEEQWLHKTEAAVLEESIDSSKASLMPIQYIVQKPNIKISFK